MSTLNEGHWAASSREEEGYSESAPTREQAIADYVFDYAPDVGTTIYVGKVTVPTLAQVNVYNAVENAAADSEWPESVADAFFNKVTWSSPTTADLQKRIDAVIAEWIEANDIFGGSFIVDEIQPYTVTQADVDASLARERERAAAAGE